MRRVILLALFSVAVAACGSRQPAAAPGMLEASDEALRPGDMVRVAFSQERSLDGEFAVDDSHRVVLPLLGQTSVEGLEGRVLRDSLTSAYERQVRNQSVQVTLLRRVRVLGEVREPGLYHVDPTMTLVDAIALAGGHTSNGRLDDVDVIRDGRVVAKNIDTNDLVGSYVRSGDQIMVPQRGWFARNAPWVVGGTVSAVAIVLTAVINSD